MRALASWIPSYLPGPALVDRYDVCDVFLVLDTQPWFPQLARAQFRSGAKVRLLAIPVDEPGERVCDLRANGVWPLRHARILRRAYGEAGARVASRVLGGLPRPDLVSWSMVEVLRRIFQELRLPDRVWRYHSRLTWPETHGSASGSLEEELIRACQATGCDAYLASPAEIDGFSRDRWEEANVQVVVHEFDGVEDSILDLLVASADPLADIRRGRLPMRRWA